MDETNKIVSFEGVDLYRGDCLEVMDRLIAEGVKVDAIITDPPYGTTACAWDSVIPFEEMWLRLNQLIKPNGAIVLFGTQPFTSLMISSNIEMFKCAWIWKKTRPSNFFAAKFVPLNDTEDICVFSFGGTNNGTKNPMKYFPQGITTIDRHAKNNNTGGKIGEEHKSTLNNQNYHQTTTGYPNKMIKFSNDLNTIHPTQKPVALIEYLIKTYTNECELVLDFTMGSGTTAVACVNTNRKCIGIERDDKYFDISCTRVDETINKPDVELF